MANRPIIWHAHAPDGFIEYYGLAVHSGASAVAYDNNRVSALSSIGWRPLIFTDATPDRVIVEQTRAFLRQVGTLTHPSGG